MEKSVSDSGRLVTTHGAKVVGVVSCVPANNVNNDSFQARFNESDIDGVIKMIGVTQRRWVDAQGTTRDLCKASGIRLLESLAWDTGSVDAIIFVSQTPDFRLPATACLLQVDLGLPTGCIAYDVNLGCSGYPYALWLGSMMIQTGAASRVLLAVGDTVSKIVDPDDRSTALLFGDAGTMTALEATADPQHTHYVLGTDGRGASNLIVPQGGFRHWDDTDDPRLEGKNHDSLFMDGGEIFNFTLRAVPALLNRTVEAAQKSIDEYDAVLFHQANHFMIKHLAKKLKLPADKVPVNIDEFGNTSSASIPLLMTSRLSKPLTERSMQLAMLGFGVGYSWAAASVRLGPLKIAETIEL